MFRPASLETATVTISCPLYETFQHIIIIHSCVTLKHINTTVCSAHNEPSAIALNVVPAVFTVRNNNNNNDDYEKKNKIHECPGLDDLKIVSEKQKTHETN